MAKSFEYEPVSKEQFNSDKTNIYDKVKYVLIIFYLFCFYYVISQYQDSAPSTTSTTNQKPTPKKILTKTSLSFNSDLDKSIFLYSNIYKNIEETYLYSNQDIENYYNINFDLPDFESNIFSVPTHKRYCLH